MQVIKNALELIKAVEFVEVATADETGKPNSAPKFFLKTDGNTIYLIDYSIGKTAENLKMNPRVSLSFIDMNSLFGYRLNGRAEVIKKGKVYDICLKELRAKEIKLTTKRIIEEVRETRTYKAYETDISGHSLVYKITIEEGSEISPGGEIEREKSFLPDKRRCG